MVWKHQKKFPPSILRLGSLDPDRDAECPVMIDVERLGLIPRNVLDLPRSIQLASKI